MKDLSTNKDYKKKDKEYMSLAIEQAKSAMDLDEIPVGAIIVKDKHVIAQAHNLKESYRDATMHAEILAIRQASKNLGHWWLEDCDMYVTLEPCAMCAGAILNARMRKVYIATRDMRMGACGSAIDLSNVSSFNHSFEIDFGLMEDKSQKLLGEFFAQLRDKS